MSRRGKDPFAAVREAVDAATRPRVRRARKATVTLNLSQCRYDVLRDVAVAKGWKVVEEEDSTAWHVYWMDTSVSPERVMKLKDHQKINHFPGMYILARKAALSKTLNRMLAAFPKEYSFFPRSWSLPAEFSEFVEFVNSGKHNRTFICKPTAGCQGKGVFLTRRWETVNPTQHQVIQRYISSPLLIDGLKFDLRVYVVVTSCDPLRVYLFKDGLVRLCTEPYVKPTGKNLKATRMHLTNYAINKTSDKFVFNADAGADGVGSKRSISWFMGWLEENGHSSAVMWDRVGDLVVKTLLAAQPSLAHVYRSCRGLRRSRMDSCFEVLGFDVLLDSKLHPWLIEVNHSPSFTCDSPLDAAIKQSLVSATLDLLNVDPSSRRRQKAMQAAQAKLRLYGRGEHVGIVSESPEDATRKLEKAERGVCGSLARVYPPLHPDEVEEQEAFASARGVLAAATLSSVYPDDDTKAVQAWQNRRSTYRAIVEHARELLADNVTTTAQPYARRAPGRAAPRRKSRTTPRPAAAPVAPAHEAAARESDEGEEEEEEEASDPVLSGDDVMVEGLTPRIVRSSSSSPLPLAPSPVAEVVLGPVAAASTPAGAGAGMSPRKLTRREVLGARRPVAAPVAASPPPKPNRRRAFRTPRAPLTSRSSKAASPPLRSPPARSTTPATRAATRGLAALSTKRLSPRHPGRAAWHPRPAAWTSSAGLTTLQLRFPLHR